MTTIDIKLDMSGEGNRPQELIYVRISKDDGGHRSDGETNRIASVSPGRAPKRGGKSPSARRTPARQPFEVVDTPMAHLSTQLHTFDARTFTITAYLPNQGMKGEKRLKLACCPGQTVQQVIETEIPTISRIPYQVYHFPSRALLNPEKEASVLQDQEIWIEPTTSPSEETSDERLGVVKELLKTEDAYLEHLKNIFDVYMEPLRNWGVPQNDMNVLFRGLSRLCDLLMNFFSELELAVKSWNTKTTLIGGIFTQYASFWDTYIEYRQSYAIAKRLLKQKRLDESFSRFLEIKRGAAMHTLESLMLLPVQRVSDYQRYLSQLLGLTDPDHPDYQYIRMTVSRIDEIMRARADELEQLENESKLEQVQLQFPNDQLFLFEPLDAGEILTPKRSRSTTVPGGVVPPRVQKMSVHCFPMDSTDGARKNPRMYIQEGPVKLLVTTKQGQLQTQDRYLFLFSDLLLIAKPASKSRTHQHRCYKMKNRLRLGEMWVANCTDNFAVLPPSQMELAFVIGWPIGLNYVALFSSRAEKELWFNLISRNVEQQCSQLQLDTTQIRIYNQTKSSTTSAVNVSSSFMIISVNALEKSSAVLKKAVDLFKLSEPHSEFQLAVKASRKDKEEVLHGHESPFAIQCQYNRQQLDQTGESRPQQLDFLIKRKPCPSAHSHRPSIIKIWKKKPKQKRVFSIPLNEVIVNNQLPEILQEIIVRLWVEGPETFGIFRQSASFKRVRELKEMIDGREQVDLSEVSIHVIGALLKDFMRNVPGGILSSERYTEFVATNDINDIPTRIARLKGVIGKLHESNQLLLRYLLPLLHHISLHENVNQMSTTNLAICFAPSLLQPDSSLDVIKNEAPTLVDFLIKFAGELYNNELPELYKQPATARASSDDLASSIELIPVKNEPGKLSRSSWHRRNFSLDTNTSASEDSLDETETESEVSPRKIPKIPIHHTASDSQIEERTGPTGMVRLHGPSKLDEGNSDMDEGDEDDEALSPSYESSNRWPRGGHGSFNKGRVRHRSGDSISSMGRRRSIATQNTNNLLPMRRQYSPDLEVIPAPPMSPSSSHSGSSHSYSPKFSHPEGGSGRSGYRSDGGTRYKKRRIPRHSSSFSKPSDLQYNRAKLAMSTSSSFYDSLMPRDRGRSQSFGPGNIHKALGEVSRLPSAVPPLSMAPSTRKVTSRAPSSKSSSQNQAGSGKVVVSGRQSTSPDPVALLESGPVEKLNRDVVKQAISCRFGISKMDWPPSVSHHAQPVPGISVSRPDKDQPRTNGTRREGAITDYPYKLQSYHNGVLSSTKPSKAAVLLESGKLLDSGKVPEQDYDERPEAEQHINDYKQQSVGRSIFGTEPVQVGHMSETGSRLTLSSTGYNSDTESSPSRTLNRLKEKLQEVTSPGLPQSSRMLPSRYSTKPGFEPESVKALPPSIKTQPATPPSPSSAVGGKQDHHRPADSPNTRFSHSVDPQFSSRSRFTSSFEKVEPSPRSRSSTVSHGSYRDRKTLEAISSPTEKEYKNQSSHVKEKLGLIEDLHIREDQVYRGKELERTRRLSVEKRQAAEDLAKNISRVQTRELRRRTQESPQGTPGTKFSPSEPIHANKSRSMPDHHRKVVARVTASPQQVKAVQVVKYELPAPKKTRRINLRTCNK